MKQVLFSFICIMFFTSCHKECHNIVSYVFELPATLSPAKDTFRIGDTITITSEFPDLVYERKTNKSYKLENWQFYPGTGIYKIDSISTLSQIEQNFYFIYDSMANYNISNVSGTQQILTGQYTYNSGNYKLSIKLIPKKEGLFYLEQGADLSLNKKQNFEGQCPRSRAGLDAAVIMNNRADNNIHMLSSSPDPHYHDWILQKPDDRFHKFGGYCFYVKD